VSAEHERVLAMIEADMRLLRAENEQLRDLCERAVDTLRYEANPVCDEWDEFAGTSDEEGAT
jgi:hypothetical protein